MGTQISVGTVADDGTGNTLRAGGQLINTVLVKIDVSTTGIFSFASATSVVVGATLTTAATAGFLYIPTMAATSSATPAAQAGTVPIAYETGGDHLLIWNGSAWKQIAAT